MFIVLRVNMTYLVSDTAVSMSRLVVTFSFADMQREHGLSAPSFFFIDVT